MTKTNRDQLAWALSFGEYGAAEAADAIMNALESAGVAAYWIDKEKLEKWMGLPVGDDNNYCDLPETEEEEQ